MYRTIGSTAPGYPQADGLPLGAVYTPGPAGFIATDFQVSCINHKGQVSQVYMRRAQRAALPLKKRLLSAHKLILNRAS